MWRPILLIATAVGCLGTTLKPGVNKEEIIGGHEITINKVPHQLALEWKGRFYCGASIISKFWAVTAAHCVYKKQPEDLIIRSGSTIKEKDGQLHQVVKIIWHESYVGNDFLKADDVAVLRVATPFHKTHIIWLAKFRPVAGANASVSGWGDTVQGSHQGSKHLLRAFVPIVDQKRCAEIYGRLSVTDRMICAGFPLGGKGPCQGDSGGPLVVGKTLVGIVSKGIGCAKLSPTIYVNVAALRSWILEKIMKTWED